MPDAASARVELVRLLNPGPGAIRTRVVHKHQLVWPWFLRKCRGKLADHRQDVVFFVEDGNNDGNGRGHASTVNGRARKMKVES
jgi:hypothetical protein